MHYPLDVLVGAAIGAGMGLASGPLLRAGSQWWKTIAPVSDSQRALSDRLIIVTSPHAGREGKLARATKAMAANGLRVVAQLRVDEVSRLNSLLRSDAAGWPIVVAAGGDGTVSAVADHIVGTEAVLGVLPLGTSNDCARSIKIPMRIENAVRLLARGRVTRLDAGRLTREGQRPRHFVHAATAGINVSFARLATRADLRERLGRPTYMVADVLALREHPSFECEIRHGETSEHLQPRHLAVINAPVFGGFLGLKVPGASLDDRALAVIMVERLGLRRAVRSGLYPALGVPGRIREIRTLEVSRLTVQTPRPLDVTLDGEIAGQIPGTFEVVPAGLRVIVPAGYKGSDH